jgi:hypothetical protein
MLLPERVAVAEDQAFNRVLLHLIVCACYLAGWHGNTPGIALFKFWVIDRCCTVALDTLQASSPRIALVCECVCVCVCVFGGLGGLLYELRSSRPPLRIVFCISIKLFFISSEVNSDRRSAPDLKCGYSPGDVRSALWLCRPHFTTT